MTDNYNDIWGMISKIDYPLTRDEIKSLLCDQVSKGRTDSLRDLTDKELFALRKELRSRISSTSPSVMLGGDLKRKRSIILRKLTAYGVDTQSWRAINAFVSDARIAGKPFRDLTMQELSQLERKMSAILAKRQAKPATDIVGKVFGNHGQFKIIKGHQVTKTTLK